MRENIKKRKIAARPATLETYFKRVCARANEGQVTGSKCIVCSGTLSFLFSPKSHPCWSLFAQAATKLESSSSNLSASDTWFRCPVCPQNDGESKVKRELPLTGATKEEALPVERSDGGHLSPWIFHRLVTNGITPSIAADLAADRSLSVTDCLIRAEERMSESLDFALMVCKQCSLLHDVRTWFKTYRMRLQAMWNFRLILWRTWGAS